VRKAYLIVIVIGIAAVIVSAALIALALTPARAGGGVELASSSYTVETGREYAGVQEMTVTDQETGLTTTVYADSWDVTTYVNVTVKLLNTAGESRTANLTASVYDARDGVSYRNTAFTKAYGGDYQLYEYSVEAGETMTIVLTIEVPRELAVTDDVVRIFFDGGVYRDGEKII
jgi:hypothetical protein